MVTGARADDSTIGVWWESNIEADLAGYNVYAVQNGAAKKINVGLVTRTYLVYERPAGGNSTIYVTAQDWTGNESGPSKPKPVTVVPVGDVIPGLEKSIQD